MNLNGINHSNGKIQLDDEYGRYLLSLLRSFDLRQSCPTRSELAARNTRAEKIPAGGTMDACTDGVSLYLEKNF